jgi:hypothetical protein
MIEAKQSICIAGNETVMKYKILFPIVINFTKTALECFIAI